MVVYIGVYSVVGVEGRLILNIILCEMQPRDGGVSLCILIITEKKPPSPLLINVSECNEKKF